MLELNEAVIDEAGHPRRLGYRYHFQDEEKDVLHGNAAKLALSYFLCP